MGISVNIDPDSLARRIKPSDPEKARVSAGKEAIILAKQCIKSHRDFSIETTLSGGYAIRLIQEARKSNFEIVMFYIGLGDPRLNIERVAIRVRNGGHHIPDSDILARHKTSMDNLLSNIHLMDQLIVIDNSTLGGEVVLEFQRGQITGLSGQLPGWVRQIKQELEKSNT